QATVWFDHPKLSGSRQQAEAVAEVASLTGENVRLRRAFLLTAPEPFGTVTVATHDRGSPGFGLGRVAGLFSLSHYEPPDNGSSSWGGCRVPAQAVVDAANEVAGGLAMHVCVMKPLYLRREDVPGDVVERESDALRAQAVAAGKPAGVVEKMVAGRLCKFYEEVVLLEQPHAMNENWTMQEVLAGASRKVGVPIRLERFLRLEVGEGIE
ncbi:unnamed protein product, partial [Closterium sp. Yama58-4]